MRKLSVIFTILFVISSILGMANVKGGHSITGTILSTDGTPLIGATVQVSGASRGAVTNERGFYKVSDIKEGAYSVRFSYLGYKTSEQRIEVKGNVTVDVQLEPQSVLGDEVIVSATRASKRTPMAFTDMKAYEIKRYNNGGDAAQVFELTPSFVATTESGIGIGNTSFSIRGTDASRINITINGFPINDPESQQVFFVNMPDVTSSASSVQIQRGVGTSTNGSGAFGATMNFQTGSLSNEPYAEINNYVGSYNSWRGNFLAGTGLINNRFSFDARISRAKSDGYVDRATSDHKSAMMSGTYYGDRSTLKATILYGEEKTGISWTGVPSNVIDTNRTYNPEGYYRDSKGVLHTYDNHTDNYKQSHYLLNYSLRFSDMITMNLGGFYTRGLGYYENYKDDAKFSKYGLPNAVIDGTIVKKSDFVVQKWLDNDNAGGTFSFDFKLASNFNLTLGGAGSRFVNHHYGKIKWAEYNTGNIPVDNEWYRSKSTKDDGNVFAKASWQVTEKLNVYGDFQYRYISYKMKGIDDDFTDLTQKHEYNFFNPKVGAFYVLNEKSSIFASFSVANREPTRSDFTSAVMSAKKPAAERLFDYEVGYKYAGGIVNAGINLYYMSYKNQLVLTGKLNDVGYAIRDNVASSFRRGIELMAGVKILDNFKWEGNLTLSQNKIKDFTYSVELYDKDPNDGSWINFEMKDTYLGTTSISFSPNVVGASQFNYEPVKNLHLVLSSKYVGKQYYDNSENSSRMLKAYFVNNMYAEYSFSMFGVKNLTFQFGVNNIFNEKYIANAWIYRAEFRDGTQYVEDGLFPQALRNYWGRLSIRF